MFTLQHLALPITEFNCPLDMYVRCDSRNLGNFLISKECFTIGEGEVATFDTYYNLFSISKWRKISNIRDLFFTLKCNGEAIVQINWSDNYGQSKVVQSIPVSLYGNEYTVHLPEFNTQEVGYLYITIVAKTEFKLFRESRFETPDEIRNKVKLAIVITHFNRADHVIPTVKKLLNFIDNYGLKENVCIFIIDNSNNLNCNISSTNLVVIENPNFGGAGGFARGLVEIKHRDFTHCLYMDDDGSCHSESIYRVLSIFQHSQIQDLALVGTLLAEEKPNIILQSGAKYQYRGWKNINFGENISSRLGIFRSERAFEKPDYGAWPFYAFKISSIKYFPFPFFVRGDDVFFGLQNQLTTIWWHGIAVLVGDLVARESPGTLYHDERAMLVINLMRNTPFLKIIKQYSKLYFSELFSYKYASARAMHMAFRDVLNGPKFFSDNMDCANVRAILKPLNYEERLIDVNLEPKFAKPVKKKTKIMYALTCKGLFLPNFMLKKGAIYQEKGLAANTIQTFNYAKIFYYCQTNNKCQILERDLLKFVNGFVTFLIDACHFIIAGKLIRKKYQNTKVGSESFWLKKFNME